jgi:hypothetical protein
MMRAVLFQICLTFSFASIGPVHAQQVFWDVNSSTVFEARQGWTIRLIFQTPRGVHLSQGLSSGAVLFEGERTAQSLAGTLYAFDRGCEAKGYEVSGTISADAKSMTLKGRAPVRDASCKIISYKDETLVFSKKETTEPAVSAPPVVSASPPASRLPASAPPAAAPPSASALPPASLPPSAPAPASKPAPPPVPGQPTPPAYWFHNGSTFFLVANGASRELYYDNPRSGMVAAGAREGSLLFKGAYSASTSSYAGTAYVFSPRCGTLSYQVSGPVTDNYQRIMMTGQMPRIDASCNIVSYFTNVLEFTLCFKDSTSSPAQKCPTVQ